MDEVHQALQVEIDGYLLFFKRRYAPTRPSLIPPGLRAPRATADVLTRPCACPCRAEAEQDYAEALSKVSQVNYSPLGLGR